MLQLTPQSRIFVAVEPVDFRKGIDGLGGLCRRERRRQGQALIEHEFRWVTDLDYRGHRLQWLECRETVQPPQGDEPTHHRFVHLTNLDVSAATVAVLRGYPKSLNYDNFL